MVFSSITFLLYFFPLVLALYFLVPGIRLKNFVLLILSWLFYAWGEGELVILMVLSSGFNYLCGLWINHWRSSKIPVGVGVVFNLLVLVYFKYVGLLVGTIDDIIGTEFNNGIDIQLPIGISFFTFQSISYLVDLSRKDCQVQRNPLNLMLFISLFPQLIAGPIVRYTQVERDLVTRKHRLKPAVQGLSRFCIGLAKKVLVADVMGELADQIFAMPAQEWYYGTTWLGVIAFGIQVYFDFSGYSDMAIGIGRVFGFHFPENFNYPYICKSVTEFWRRWHLTLSTWFRDYLYIPMGGNRKGIKRQYFNLVLVFFVTGLWHGATWNFVVWGLVHGLLMILERNAFGRFLKRSAVVGHVYALLAIFTTYAIFRAPGFMNAMDYYACMVRVSPEVEGLLFSDIMTNKYAFVMAIGVIFSMPVKLAFERLSFSEVVYRSELFSVLKAIFYLSLLVLSVMSIAASTYNPFIYFRF